MVHTTHCFVINITMYKYVAPLCNVLTKRKQNYIIMILLTTEPNVELTLE